MRSVYFFVSLSVSCLLAFFSAQASGLDFEHCDESIAAGQDIADERGEEVSRVQLSEFNDSAVILSGHVTWHFLDVIKKLPDSVEVLALELSSGGDSIAAMYIAKAIRRRGLSTYVGLTRCHSACTLLFQAGVERIVDPGALFSYHGPSGSGACTEEILEKGLPLYVELGYPESRLGQLKYNYSVSFETAQSAFRLGIATKIQAMHLGRDEELRKVREARRELE